MRKIVLTIVAALLATSALAGGGNFSSFNIGAGSFSASGFASVGQSGSWSVGAMNQSYGNASASPACTSCGRGVTINTDSGSQSEGFGSNFHGFTGAGGAGFGSGFSSGRFR